MPQPAAPYDRFLFGGLLALACRSFLLLGLLSLVMPGSLLGASMPVQSLPDPPELTGLAFADALPFEAIVARIAGEKVVYVGEVHTRYEDHLLQLRVIRALQALDPKLAIGMEMFSRSVQALLDAYLGGRINEAEFLAQSRYFSRWGFDYRLYREIINFARNHGLPLIALNQEKEIVSKVFREGIASLTSEELAQIPPDRDLELPGYRDRLEKAYKSHGHAKSKPEPETFQRFVEAQALWDETMAESIANFIRAHPEHRVIVLAGKGHTEKSSGIPPRLSRRLPEIGQAVMVNAGEDPVDPKQADFVIFSPAAPLPPAPALGLSLTHDSDGVRVSDLLEDGGAKKAGIRIGDVIVALDGRLVKDRDGVKISLLAKEKGGVTRVRLLRRVGFFFPEKREMELEVTL